MKVLHVASEAAPWAQTGGLADVVGSLPAAQARVAGAGFEVAALLPLYRGVSERARARGVILEPTGIEVSADLGGAPVSGKIVAATHGRTRGAGDRVFFVDSPVLYDRPGGLYGSDGGDHPDNAVRFAFLARAAVDAGARLLGGLDLVHCHDWQSGLVPVYLAQSAQPVPTVFTVHNLAYQGLFPAEVAPVLGIDWSMMTHDQLEFFGSLSFIKGGLAFADAVTTVSPTYAHEILTPEHGGGLHGFLTHHVRSLTGILTGIDTEAWDPTADPALPVAFRPGRLAGKAVCRDALAEELDLALTGDDLLCVVISRFAAQKGMDLVADIIPELFHAGAKLAVLGTGDPALEERFAWLAERFRNHLSVHVDFDVPLAHRMYAAGDVLLMPSRFEPCGLNQMYAMRYGTLPIVHSVGGLHDTVIDPDDDAARATGFCFTTPTAVSLWAALQRASAVRAGQPQLWRTMIDSAMSRDWSWNASARRYLDLYRSVIDD
ncbi:MAG TPA: glycogen synthase GlgA [Kofleriaceae bacterium]|nr:glycogen synthase GlgA [Kofleriaceae bacterium]